MNLPLSKNKKGFTIIEVALVLAVGGLIMLMVFIAWPAVQRNQRDSQRRTVDLPRLYTALSNYMSNNSGSIPKGGALSNDTEGQPSQKRVLVTADPDTGKASGTSAWATFYNNYLVLEGDTFSDPSGGPYNLNIIPCSKTATDFSKPNTGIVKVGTPCNNSAAPTGLSVMSFLSSDGRFQQSFGDQGQYITIVVGASCNGEQAVAATAKTGGARKYAIMYKLEAGGVFCQSN